MNIPISEVKKALKDLMQGGRLVFTYRDPCSYVEIPAMQNHKAS
jgi:TusA-related sulfurtransferase